MIYLIGNLIQCTQINVLDFEIKIYFVTIIYLDLFIYLHFKSSLVNKCYNDNFNVINQMVLFNRTDH